MLLLECLELVVEPVVRSVRDLGLVEDVVAVEVVLELLAQVLDSPLRCLGRHEADASRGGSVAFGQ